MKKAMEPAKLSVAEATAMQAFANGVANEGQQKDALDWILRKACASPDWAFRESARETDVMLGRHFVAQQIVGAIRINVSQLRKIEEKHG